MQWRRLTETEQHENRDNKARIEELEMKNRLLNEKLNGKIFQHATAYRE